MHTLQLLLQQGGTQSQGGGIYGTVKHVDTNGKVEVEIARGVTIEVDRSYVFADVSALQTNQPQQK